MERSERRKQDRIMFLMGLIAGLLAVIAVELGGVDYALFSGFEVVNEATE